MLGSITSSGSSHCQDVLHDPDWKHKKKEHCKTLYDVSWHQNVKGTTFLCWHQASSSQQVSGMSLYQENIFLPTGLVILCENYNGSSKKYVGFKSAKAFTLYVL